MYNSPITSRILGFQSAGISRVAFDQRFSCAAIGLHEGDVGLVSIEGGALIAKWRSHDLAVNGVLYSRNDEILFSAGHFACLKVWSVPSKMLLASLVDEANKEMPHSSFALSESNKGDLIATTGQGHVILVWDWRQEHLLARIQGHSRTIWSLAFSPDDRFLASADGDGELIVWDWRNGNRSMRCVGHEEGISCARFSPCGRLLVSAGADERLFIWNANSGECINVVDGFEDIVVSIGFSPSGDSLFVAEHHSTIWKLDWPSLNNRTKLTSRDKSIWIAPQIGVVSSYVVLAISVDGVLVKYDFS